MQIGKKLDETCKQKLYEKMNKILNIDNPITNYKFIGNHPVSLTNDNVILLLKNDYMVCEKSDGVRMLLLIFDNIQYFYDRKNDVYEVQNMHMPDCILDGELFYDNSSNLRFGIFDCLAYDKEKVLDKNLLKRLYFCEKFVKQLGNTKSNSITDGKTHGIMTDSTITDDIKAKNDAGQYEDANENYNVKKKKVAQNNIVDIDIYVKHLYKSYGFLEIYNQIKDLKHKNDGLIFTPVHDKYILYKRGTHLKWKPPAINTIDFRIVKSRTNVYDLKCTYKKNEIVFDKIYDDCIAKSLNGENITEDVIDGIDGKIGEFVYNKDKRTFDIDNYMYVQGGWELYRIRDDKDTPNHYKVVNNILECLDDNLDIEELSRYYKPMRNNFKLRQV